MTQKNSKVFDFTADTYEWLKKLALTGKWDAEHEDGYLGFIKQGAVRCDIIVIEDKGLAEEDYCFGGRFAIDAKYYLLGEDTGYGEIKGVPYDCVSGFYGYLMDTYEDTAKGLLELFDECLNDDEKLVNGSKNTDLTWEKVEACEDDRYPGYKEV